MSQSVREINAMIKRALATNQNVYVGSVRIIRAKTIKKLTHCQSLATGRFFILLSGEKAEIR